jgi:SAM-dependent methyltransferase
MGEPVIDIAAPDAYRLWSSCYDDGLNPLLALEARVLRGRLDILPGRRLLDVAAGTGRWAAYGHSKGAHVICFDASPEMLAIAAAKPGLRGRMALADMRAIPFADGSADLAVCSFALGYLDSVCGVMTELARVSRRIVLSDLHPVAVAAGWSRSFHSGAHGYRIRSHSHSLSSIAKAAEAAGLLKQWELEAHFGAPERRIFRAAGKSGRFDQLQQIPAIFAHCWGRP